jgi:endonuclease G
VTTNVVPQLQKDTAWQQLEGDINRFVRNPKNLSNEVYVITGRNGSSDTIPSLPPDHPTLIRDRTNPFKINVPEALWKVVLIPEAPGQSPTDITTKAISFGVLLQNIDQYEEGIDWRQYIFPVNEIEAYTGYNFFSNIPTEVQEAIENNTTLPPFF